MEQTENELKVQIRNLNQHNAEMSVLYAQAQESRDECEQMCNSLRGEVTGWQGVVARSNEDIEGLRHEVARLNNEKGVAVDMYQKQKDGTYKYLFHALPTGAQVVLVEPTSN